MPRNTEVRNQAFALHSMFTSRTLENSIYKVQTANSSATIKKKKKKSYLKQTKQKPPNQPTKQKPTATTALQPCL